MSETLPQPVLDALAALQAQYEADEAQRTRDFQALQLRYRAELDALVRENRRLLRLLERATA